MSSLQRGSLRPLLRAERFITQQQKRDRVILSKSMLGRPLELPTKNQIMSDVPAWARRDSSYLAVGYICVPYILQTELARQRGKTFYNTTQINSVIASLPRSMTMPLRVSRGELEVVKCKTQLTDDTRLHYWLRAPVGRVIADPRDGGTSVDLRQEELAIANALFEEDNDLTDRSYLWLGGVASKSQDAVNEMLDELEDVIPAQIAAGPMSLVVKR